MIAPLSTQCILGQTWRGAIDLLQTLSAALLVAETRTRQMGLQAYISSSVKIMYAEFSN